MSPPVFGGTDKYERQTYPSWPTVQSQLEELPEVHTSHLHRRSRQVVGAAHDADGVWLRNLQVSHLQPDLLGRPSWNGKITKGEILTWWLLAEAVDEGPDMGGSNHQHRLKGKNKLISDIVCPKYAHMQHLQLLESTSFSIFNSKDSLIEHL